MAFRINSPFYMENKACSSLKAEKARLQKEIADILEKEVPQHIIKGSGRTKPTQNNNKKQQLIDEIKRLENNG